MAGSKVSALTALAAEPADTDEFYINDGGVSKRITYATIKALFATAAQGTAAGTALQDVVDDTSPTLGGTLDADGNDITGVGLLSVGGHVQRSVAAGVTAHVGSSQGDGPITTDIVQLSTVANAGDAVTLPAAAAGLEITIINNGANAADVFPASGDNLGAGADTAASLAAGANITYVAYDTTNWFAKT